MTRVLAFLSGAFFFICSCNSPSSTGEVSEKDDTLDVKAGIARLNDILKKHEEPSQLFDATTSKPSVVTGQKGTIIYINPTDLITESGKPLGESIRVELKELTDQGQLLRANAQTVSDGRLLVSGGAYFIAMTSNGDKLKLKEGKNLGVRFPRLSDQPMMLFYGQRDELGNINWSKANEVFKTSQQKAISAGDTTQKQRKKRQSEIDAVIDYIDLADTTTTEEERKAMAENEKKNKIIGEVYDEIGLYKFGWINCDKFLEVDNATDLNTIFNPKDSIKYANVYLVFKDLRSIVQGNYYQEKMVRFENLPVGYKVKLIAFAVKDEKVFAYATDLTISKGQKITLDLSEIQENDLRKVLDKK